MFVCILLMFERVRIPDTTESQIQQLQVVAVFLIDFGYGELSGDIFSPDVCYKCDSIPHDVGILAKRLYD